MEKIVEIKEIKIKDDKTKSQDAPQRVEDDDSTRCWGVSCDSTPPPPPPQEEVMCETLEECILKSALK